MISNTEQLQLQYGYQLTAFVSGWIGYQSSCDVRSLKIILSTPDQRLEKARTILGI